MSGSHAFDSGFLLARSRTGSPGLAAPSAWRWNPLGQLGTGSTADRPSPTTAAGLTNVASVAAGTYHTLALKTDGTVWAWGWNALGQLGDGTTLERHLPVPVAGTARASSVTAPAVDRHAPVVVAGLTGVRSASAGAFHSLSVGMDGTVKAWGWTGYGALGTGGADSWRPVAVPVTKAGVVAAGGFHSVVS